MHLLEDGSVALSPSDLTGFAACEHLTQLELTVVRDGLPRPRRDDPMLDVLSRRGGEHETAQLERFRAEGKDIVEIDMPTNSTTSLQRAERLTLAAMRTGADVIYQATFFAATPGSAVGWRGHADFLLRVDDLRSPELGGWSYEVADAKLATRVKAAALLQMCAYSEQVERLQGVAPRRMHVITGDGTIHPFPLTDYDAYYRTLQARFVDLVDGPSVPTYPEPVDHCGICRWGDHCKARRRADDHLSLVAGMRRDQSRRLADAGITTRRGLAVMEPGTRVPDVGDATLERLRHQAELQVEGEGEEPPRHELLPPELPDPADPTLTWPHRGWALLPNPSPGDLYFDIEGDPFALDDPSGTGLEYLFGVTWIDPAAGTPQYRAFWAHDRAAEGRAFEQFVDLVEARRAEHPDLHVYHYAPYELTAMKRLMGAHHTREEEIDAWLRAELFVDLYAVVRAGVRIGAESYSLKTVEHLYLQQRGEGVTNAADSIVAYEEYLERHDPARLDAIEAYNADDCRSTLELHRWLERGREHVVEEHGELPRPDERAGEAPGQVAARAARVEELTRRLLANAPEDELPARQLLADMLDWHRRESKPDWWTFFARQKMSADELFDDRECISGLEFVEDVAPVDRSIIQRFTFPVPQEHKFKGGDKAHDAVDGGYAGEVVRVDDVAGELDLKRGLKLAASHPDALIPPPPIGTGVLENAIERMVEHVIAHGLHDPGSYRAGLDLVVRTPHSQSCRATQGPPGSGKTTTAAKEIVELVAKGKRVGITAPSHAVIGNLLEAVGQRGAAISALQKADDHQRCEHGIVECTGSSADVERRVEEFDVIAGTVWLWARPKMEHAVDVLFVDEAAQKSLADVLAVCGAASEIRLFGDPQQLAQPSKGAHPKGSEVSALEHLLAGAATMPEELGRFLEHTYRMHPSICEFVSAVAYEGRLHPAPGEGLERQAVAGESGLRYVPVVHEGNRSWSAEEVQVVDELVRGLVGTEWTDRTGFAHELTLDDILVVTPYNAQVAKLTEALPGGARVGTVDKFQGQQAPVVVYSMATSSADDVPRSMEFLYDLHRLNVAVSRAKALSIVVASPELMRVQCKTPTQLRLANAVCRLPSASAAR